MRNFIHLWVFVLAILEVSTLTIGRNIENSETNVDEIGKLKCKENLKILTKI